LDAENVHQTLAYSSRKLSRRWLEIGLVLLAAGGVLAYIRPDSFTLFDWIMLPITLVLGVGLTLYALLRLWVPGKPLLRLSPAGVRLHIQWVKDIVIPWHEVLGVDTVDITGEVRGYPVVFSGVTVVLVSRRFYDRHIHVTSWFLRGPGWDTNFIPKGSTVEVALHHEALPATAQELRAAVEARWHAFRETRRAIERV
jgi:hypothetical protein